MNRHSLVASLALTLACSVAPTKDGFYVALVPKADPTWLKVGQLQRVHAAALPAE